VRPADARIELADIPFVPLRNRFRDLGEMPGRFNTLVAACSRQLRTDRGRRARVEMNARLGVVTVDGVRVRLRARAMQTLRFRSSRVQGTFKSTNTRGICNSVLAHTLAPLHRTPRAVPSTPVISGFIGPGLHHATG
jgi:hypothetical protein